MNRIQIINHLIQKYGYKNYLEIGVHTKSLCFDHIIAEHKTSVDPGYENTKEEYDFKMESDVFFDQFRAGRTEFPKDHKWDIIFIDGLHLADQVERDILNSLKHLSPNGTVVMHDCNPSHELIAREKPSPQGYSVPNEWCGTVWKAFYKFRSLVTGISMWCVEDDYGVGIIQFGEQKLAPFDNPFYEYEVFNKNRKEYLNLISPEEFLKLFEL
jgi:hypothetical protein